MDSKSRLLSRALLLQVHLDRVFPVQQVTEAQRALEASEITGRVVIEM